VPRYLLVRRFPDGHEEPSDVDSKDEHYSVGDMLPLGAEDWRVIEVESVEGAEVRARLVAEQVE
jgi:hypothetical protein